MQKKASKKYDQIALPVIRRFLLVKPHFLLCVLLPNKYRPFDCLSRVCCGILVSNSFLCRVYVHAKVGREGLSFRTQRQTLGHKTIRIPDVNSFRMCVDFFLFVCCTVIVVAVVRVACEYNARTQTNTHTHIQSIWIEMECHLCCLLQLIGLCRASIAIAPSVCAGIGTRKKTTSSEKCPFDGRIRFPIYIYRARTAKQKVRTVGYS